MNVGQILRRAALAWPDQIGLVDLGHPGASRRAWLFSELDQCARCIAALLISRGLQPGQSVGLIGENSAELVAAWFGIVYAGCAVVPLAILSTAAELRFRVTHAACGAVLFDSARSGLVTEALQELHASVLTLELGQAISTAITPVAQPAETSASDAAMILYTSGTTGTAKGAVISHDSLSLHTDALVRHALALTPDDRVLGALPLTHSYGCRLVMLASVNAGARCVLVPRFDAKRVLTLLADEAISFFPGVPTMYAALGAEPYESAANESAPTHLRLCLCAGAPLADETARRAERRLGCEVRQGYGMTEATFCTVNAAPDVRVLGSVGKPVPGVEVRLLDANGHDVEPGREGEIVVRGPNTMSRYLHDPAATAEVGAGGFIHSGDIGRMDPEGRLWIVDRIKDLIIRGGYNIYPAELEAALAAHPDVHDVAVVGRPDNYYGEEIVAVVVWRDRAKPALAELAAFAQARLGALKRPREYASLEALPLGPSGKVQKRVLREWLREGRLVLWKSRESAILGEP